MSRDRYKSTTVKFRTDDPLQMKAWDILHERLKEGKSLSRAISEAVVTLEEIGGTGRLSAGVLTETDLSGILESQTEHICASQREMLDNYFDTLYKRLGDLWNQLPGMGHQPLTKRQISLRKCLHLPSEMMTMNDRELLTGIE